MPGLVGSVILIVYGFYLFLAYPFFLIPVFAYWLGKHPVQDKVMRTISGILTPLVFPIGILLWVGWQLVSILAGFLVVILFAQVAWLAWLNAHFPLGKVFRAWFKAANWVLQKVQEFLELIGIKKLFFGIPFSSFQLVH